ncbi:MAG TPA: inorganic pyrophosphatase [Polyangiaceae bacterium]|jgi:inorganic pyrophosphatase|nr:inorganic pyrophosphatase [Polyangiaceae bacterium]
MPQPVTELDELIAMMFQAHPWHGVPARNRNGELQAFIELVPTDAVKYELDKASGHLRLDRPQRYSSLCPTLYGFIPRTYCGRRVGTRSSERTAIFPLHGDGDPMDICVLTEKTVVHGNFLATVRPIGGLRMIDGDEADDKIIAVLHDDIVYGKMEDIHDCPPALLERVKHYFLTYKQQPGSAKEVVRIPEVYDREEAENVIKLSTEDYRDEFGAPEKRIRRLAYAINASEPPASSINPGGPESR